MGKSRTADGAVSATAAHGNPEDDRLSAHYLDVRSGYTGKRCRGKRNYAEPAAKCRQRNVSGVREVTKPNTGACGGEALCQQ